MPSQVTSGIAAKFNALRAARKDKRVLSLVAMNPETAAYETVAVVPSWRKNKGKIEIAETGAATKELLETSELAIDGEIYAIKYRDSPEDDFKRIWEFTAEKTGNRVPAS